VADLVRRRVEWRAEDYADPHGTMDRWWELKEQLREAVLEDCRADRSLHEELAALRRHSCSDPSDKLAVYRQRQLAIVERILHRPEEVTPRDLEDLGRSPGNFGGAKAWGGAHARNAFRRRLKDLVDRFAELGLWFAELTEADEQAARDLAALTHLADRANDLYARAKRAEGMLDFDDLVDLSARLLSDRPGVRERLRSSVGQFLIDECQDTDAGQLTMLWDMLCDGDRAPAGKLFIVGDVKQSIYRFRGARAEVFDGLCRSFGQGRVSLGESFRTHRAGAAFVNHVFSPLMGAGYEPIASARDAQPDGPAVEILLAECGEDAGAEEVVSAQARVTAWRIAEMIGRERRVWDREKRRWREVRPGDVAILFARMTQSLEYERALQDCDVPYYVVAGTGFFRQQEVYDVLNALKAIDNPCDDVALAGVLRSAMFGLDDNVLLHLAEAAGPPYFPHLRRPDVLGRLEGPMRARLVFAAGLLGRLHADKDALGPAGLIESLLSETAYEQVLLSQFNGRQKLGNVRRMLDAARGAAALSLADFVQRYGEFVLAASRRELAAVAGEDEDVVRIMTIHKAKGLEFPVVFIPDLNAGSRGPSASPLLFRSDWGVTFRPPQSADDEADGPLIHELARRCERAELAAEDVRKLYVAVTRHQDHLVLVGADYRSRDGRFRSSSSHLAQLDEVLDISRQLGDEPVLIPYGPDAEGFRAALARIEPYGPARRPKAAPVGRKVAAAAACAADVVEGLFSAAGEDVPDMPLIGPLPDTAGGATVAATALADFQHCPMLYRWRHELRAPDRAAAGTSGAKPALDAATVGTVLHRCMELADLSGPDLPARAQALLGRAFAEMELSADPAPLAAELAGMLERFAQSPLSASIRTARRRLRELSFLLQVGGLTVAGQIDLLFQDAEGAWHVVDYKSDRVGPDDLGPHAERYEVQMALYMAAAARHLAQPVPDATLYFLRPGLGWRLEAPPDAAAPSDRLGELAAQLARSRRTGTYQRRDDRGCPRCAYEDLCRRRR
jgi:ATP-dependent helicase/nuclease subunit A